MADSETPTWKLIWNSRPVMAVAAFLGALLAVSGLALAWWNEHKAIQVAISLQQGAAGTVSVSADKVDPANSGKLVHLSGEAMAEDMVTDPQLGIAVKALRMTREVELYQWKETKEEKKDSKPKYSYDKVWAKEKPAQSFNEPKFHDNPKGKPFDDIELVAPVVKVGAFALSSGQVKRIAADEPVTITAEMLAALPADIRPRAQPDGAVLYIGMSPNSDPGKPVIGDVRVRYKIARPQTISLIAMQTNDSFEPFTPTAGEPIDLLEKGKKPASAMFQSAQTNTVTLNWILRVVAFLVVGVGVYLVFRRQIIAGSGAEPTTWLEIKLSLFAIALGLPLCLLAVGARLVLHQPVFGAGALASGLLFSAGVVMLTRNRKAGLFAGALGGGGKWTAEERELFRRYAMDPDNTAVRSELAAKLEKSGEPMGECIRLALEFESLPEGDADRKELENQYYELVHKHGPRWFQPLAKLGLYDPASPFFPFNWIHHGIIDHIDVNQTGVLPEQAHKLFAAVPGLRSLDMCVPKLDVASVADLPQMQQIGVLNLGRGAITLEDFEVLTSSPNFENVVHLQVGIYKPEEDGAAWRLAEETGAPRIPAPKPEVGKLLAESASLRRLRVLELANDALGDEGVAALVRSDRVAQLATLNLSYNQIGAKGAAALAASPNLKNLHKLNLLGNLLGPAEAATLAASPHLRQLNDLELSDNPIGHAGALALVRSPIMAKLLRINLTGCQLGQLGARYIAACPHFGKLEILELFGNEIDDVGAAALAAGKHIRSMKELNLGTNKIGDAGLKALANWPVLAGVIKLTLSANKFGLAGLKALAASPFLHGVAELDLCDNQIGVEGARVLAASPALTGLKCFHIRDANLTADGEKLLKKRFGNVAMY